MLEPLALGVAYAGCRLGKRPPPKGAATNKATLATIRPQPGMPRLRYAPESRLRADLFSSESNWGPADLGCRNRAFATRGGERTPSICRVSRMTAPPSTTTTKGIIHARRLKP